MHKQKLTHNEVSEATHNKMRLAQLKKLKGAFTALIGDEQSIQSMKNDRLKGLSGHGSKYPCFG